MSQMVAPASTSYHNAGLDSVISSPPGGAAAAVTKLSAGAGSFLRWLSRWFQETGESLFPSTGYLAKKQGKTERTIYRWLAELRAAGAILTEVVPGVERRITPQVSPTECPPPRRRRAKRSKKMSGVLSGALSGVAPYTGDAYTQGDNKQQARNDGAKPQAPLSAVAAALVGLGVAHPVAAGLVQVHGEEVCRKQIVALPLRKALNPVAVLVQSIKGAWAPPAGIVQREQEVQKQAVDASRIAAERQKAKERAEHRTALETRFTGLPAGLQAELTRQAAELWQAEQPAAARIMAGRPGAVAVVRSYALRLMEKGGQVNV